MTAQVPLGLTARMRCSANARKAARSAGDGEDLTDLTRTTQQANHAPSPSEWGMRVGAAYTQTGVLAKGRAEGSAGEIEELGREQGLAGASPSPKGAD